VYQWVFDISTNNWQQRILFSRRTAAGFAAAMLSTTEQLSSWQLSSAQGRVPCPQVREICAGPLLEHRVHRDQWEGNTSKKVTKLSVWSRFMDQLMEVEPGKGSLGMGVSVYV
jgi:hypothetical protein